jgi:hypothetical protein
MRETRLETSVCASNNINPFVYIYTYMEEEKDERRD